ncbi:MAG: folate-binding protein, partial [Pseudomonadota bacterium]
TLFIFMTAKGVFIDVARGRGAGLLKRLKLYRLRAKIEMEDVTANYSVGQGDAPADSLLVHLDPRHKDLGPRWLAPQPSSDPDQEDILRQKEIDLGIPRFREDYQETSVFPLDVNLDALNGIDHKKGCFVGQEVASRMFRKGEIRKRSWKVQGEALTVGTALLANGKTIGTLTSVLGHQAIALLRLDRFEAEDDVTTEEGRPVTLQKPDYL